MMLEREDLEYLSFLNERSPHDVRPLIQTPPPKPTWVIPAATRYTSGCFMIWSDLELLLLVWLELNLVHVSGIFEITSVSQFQWKQLPY